MFGVFDLFHNVSFRFRLHKNSGLRNERLSSLQLAAVASVLHKPEVKPLSYSFQTLFFRVTFLTLAPGPTRCDGIGRGHLRS